MIPLKTALERKRVELAAAVSDYVYPTADVDFSNGFSACLSLVLGVLEAAEGSEFESDDIVVRYNLRCALEKLRAELGMG